MVDPISLTWFAAAAIQIVLKKVTSEALQRWASRSGHVDDLEILQTTLLKVGSLISNAERMPNKDRSLVELLKQLKDTAYDAEDLLDKFEYQHLKQIVEARQDVQASTSLPSKIAKQSIRAANQVCHCLSSELHNIANCCLTCEWQSTTTVEIQKIVDRLELNYTGLREIIGVVGASSTMQHVTTKRPETASTLVEPEILGRNKERDRIIEMLLESGDESRSGRNNNVSVVSIIGIGGVGKTTLAQYVYNDKRVEEFKARAWVCISNNFDAKKVIKEIIVSVNKNRIGDLHDATNLDYIAKILKEELNGKKFLLILDDVWTDQWSTTLLPQLECGGKGSKVVITCREEKFVGMMGVANKIMLEGLASDDYLSLFEKYAFGDKNPVEYGSLRFIGTQIAKKLKGSPLAAKTIGGMLNSNLDVEYWRKILKSGICISGQDGDDILPVLRFSYTQLPEHLQRCFAYCAVFPKDYEFDKDMLVQIWIAHGFILGDGEERPEDIGREYFDDLLHGSFFQYNAVQNRPYYTMHDLMNDLAKTVSMGECFRLEGGDGLRMIPETIRHLCVSSEHLHELKNLGDLKNLRTVLLFGSDESKFDNFRLQDVFKKLKSVRALVLDDIPNITKLPNAISHLIHLRTLHLDLGGFSSHIKLPEALSKLYHLQVLRLPSSYYTLPKNMNNLIHLRHLYGKNEQISKIARIGNLTSLQELQLFSIGKQSGHKISQLMDLRELRGELCIKNLENVESDKEAIAAKLNDKSHIAELSLEWGSARIPMPTLEQVVFENLQPHHNLKRLSIEHYGGVRSPNWMRNSMPLHIESIYLTNCTQWEVLPPLGQLRFLKVLKMEGMKAVTHVDHTFYGDGEYKGFPSLKELRYKGFPKWEKWSGVEGCYLFPRLHELEIINCPKLRGMPPLPPSLRKLAIEEAGLITLPSVLPSSLTNLSFRNGGNDLDKLLPIYLQNLTSLSELEIWRCPQIRSLPSAGVLGHLTSLQKLSLKYCAGLTTLGPGLQALISLQDLVIEKCPRLTSLQLLHHLTSLQELSIMGCEELMSLRGLQTLVSLNKLTIEKCPKLTVDLAEHESLLPSSLQYLHIRSGGDLDKSLPIYLQNLTSLSYLRILECPQVTSLPSVEVLGHLTSLRELVIDSCEELTSLGGLQALTSLRDLSLTNCANLQSLPADLRSLPSLQYLLIKRCRGIKSLPKKGLPTSLLSLYISDCNRVLEERCRKDQGADWRKIAHIPSIRIESDPKRWIKLLAGQR